MAEDIRIKTAFLQHPKTLELKTRLGAEGVLSLIRLWCHVAQSRPDGSLPYPDFINSTLKNRFFGL